MKFPIQEILRNAGQALFRNWGRAVLTSLSMVVGTASLVLVVVVGISGREYTLEQIRGVGTNLVSISNEGAPPSDRINFMDLDAIRREIPHIQSAAAVVTAQPSLTMEGLTHRVTLIGTSPEYEIVRNIQIVRGRFMDESDLNFRNKVCLVTEYFDEKLQRDPFYDGHVTFYGIRFKVIGVFRERVSTFGQTEVVDFSAIAPISVVRFFKGNDTIDFLYVSADDMRYVPEVSTAVKSLLIARHRNQSFYRVDNLAAILDAANKISMGLTLLLLVIATISLVSSGISIMNVMLITVTERTREIGVKKAVGAQRRILLTEFLTEALILSGG
ncbi:MAG: ABC transporter permease, partial [Acidobacteriota bacterium]|nr:ABC transporter permease [Acidobacteriota bacterium]